jgi:hypothetical protein
LLRPRSVIFRQHFRNLSRKTVPLKSLKKGVGSGSISQRYGPGDPDPHQNVTDSQHCVKQSYFTSMPSEVAAALLRKNHTVSTGSRLPASDAGEMTNDREGNCEEY